MFSTKRWKHYVLRIRQRCFKIILNRKKYIFGQDTVDTINRFPNGILINNNNNDNNTFNFIFLHYSLSIHTMVFFCTRELLHDTVCTN